MPRSVLSGDRIYTIGSNGQVQHTTQSHLPHWHPLHDAPKHSTLSIATHPNLAVVFLATDDGHIHTYNTENHYPIHTSPTPLPAPAISLYLSPQSDALYAGTATGALLLVDLTSLQFKRMLGEGGVEHSAAINTIIADSRHLFTGGQDSLVYVWELSTSRPVRSLSLQSAPVCSLLRRDDELWIGMSNGSLQVLQIYGEVENGVDSEEYSTSHDAPITQIVPVGKQEVWTISHNHNAHDDLNCIIAWDLNDMSRFIPPRITSHPIDSVVVLDRAPMETVSLLVLDAAFNAETIIHTVAGRTDNDPADSERSESNASRDSHPPQAQETFDTANPKYHSLEQVSNQQLGNPHPSNFRRSSLIFSPAPSPLHTATTVTLPQSISENSQAAKSHDAHSKDQRYSLPLPTSETDAAVKMKRHSLPLPGHIAQDLEISLSRAANLLGGLVAENMQTFSHDGGHTKNEALRTFVANITKEIDIGRRLVSRTGANPESPSMISADQSLPPLPAGSETSSCSEKPDEQANKGLSRETEYSRVLEKHLSVVMRERDLLASDVRYSQTQYDSTLSSLESLLRDSTENVKAKDKELEELREKCNVFRTRYEEEAKRRKEQEEMFREQTENLSIFSRKASQSVEAELVAAHDKIKEISVEAESYQDSLHVAKAQIDELKENSSNLLAKCESLTETHAIIVAREETCRAECDEKMTSQEASHQKEIETLESKHHEAVTQLELRCQSMSSDVEERRRKMKAQEIEHTSLVERQKTEIVEIESRLHAVIEARSSQAADNLSYQELLSGQGEIVSKLKKNEVESRAREQLLQDQIEEQKEDNDIRKENEEKLKSELQEKVETVLNFRLQVVDMQEKINKYMDIETTVREESAQIAEEKRNVEQELEHRRAANELHEAEISAKDSVVAHLHSALEVIRNELANAEAEARDMRERLDAASDRETSQCNHIKKLEEHIEATRIPSAEEPVDDSTKAIRALLASANGEIEQLSNQLDAMQRAHVAQEQELNELRESLSFRDDVIRRKNASLEALRERQVPEEGEEQRPPHTNPSVDTSDEVEQTSRKVSTQITSNVANLQTSERKPKSISVRGAEICVNEALEEAQNQMTRTKEKLNEITSIARQYKEAAQAHRNALPALVELEGELLRVARIDSRKAAMLKSARGVVQSMIAQYFSDNDKVTVLRQYDENMYAASPERQNALEDALAEMRMLRTGESDTILPSGSTPTDNNRSRGLVFSEDRKRNLPFAPADGIATPRRYLSF